MEIVELSWIEILAAVDVGGGIFRDYCGSTMTYDIDNLRTCSRGV